MPARLVMLFLSLGLTLCFARETFAADLLTPTANAPLYELSNLRAERDQFGRAGISVDFKRTRQGEGSVSISGKSARGPISIIASIPSFQDSGTMRLESWFGSDVVTDIELYLVQEQRLSATNTMYSMVSNAVRLGNPGNVSTPREWTADEKSMHKEFVRIMNDDSAHKPPKSYPVSVKAPDGSEFVPNTAKLTKGTRLQACFQDKWSPLTTISENDDGSVNVRWDDFGAQYDCSMIRGELVIATSLLSSLGKHPASRFAQTVPNWASESAKNTKPVSPNAKPRKRYQVTIEIPSDSQLVPQDLKLKPGIPLQACFAGKWNPITALGEYDDGALEVRWDEYGEAFDCSMVRDELIIKKELAQQLRTNPASVKISAPTIAAKPRKSYPVSIAVPSDSEFVPKNADLKPGTKLEACYGGKWNPITFLSANSDGTLTVRWDDYGPSFDCSMVRNELIIKKAVLKEPPASSLPASSPSASGPTASNLPSSSPPIAEIRTFTDSTGKFKVKATIVKQTDTQVTLLTDKGKEVTLPLSKLSAADQEFLRSNANAKNPFE
jgi:ribosomal protein L11